MQLWAKDVKANFGLELYMVICLVYCIEEHRLCAHLAAQHKTK